MAPLKRKRSRMPVLFVIAFVSTALVLVLSLGEMNPFRREALPMLEQIERYASGPEVETVPAGLLLAA